MGFLKIIDEVADRKIRESYEKGEFASLRGKGERLVLEDDSLVPEDLRMAYKILKNSGHLPPDVQSAKDIQETMDLLDKASDEGVRLRQMRRLEVFLSRLGPQSKVWALLEHSQDYYRKVLDRMRGPESGAANESEQRERNPLS